MSTLRVYQPTRCIFKRLVSKQRTIQMIKLSKYRFSTPTPHEILFRSILSDASKTQQSISFSTVYSLAKSFADSMHTLESAESHIIKASEYIRQQAPGQIAHSIMNLKNLPYGLSETSSIESVMNDLIAHYEQIYTFPSIATINDVEKYIHLQREYLSKDLLAIPKICHGLSQKSAMNNAFTIESSGTYLNAFLNKFGSQRLASRVMAAHLISFYQQINSNNNLRKIGIFDEKVDIIKCIKMATSDSKKRCKRTFNLSSDDDVPSVNIIDKRKNKQKFTYIAPHLHHMLYELLKNSLRAVVEHGKSDQNIDVIVVDSTDNYLTIKISDIGGGIPRNVMKDELIWLYGYTSSMNGDNDGLDEHERILKQRDLLGEVIQSAELELSEKRKTQSDEESLEAVLGAVRSVPMFGLGYGLPVVKVYAEYFGGDVKIQSIDSYGTDAYLTVHDLSDSVSAMT